MIIHYKLKFNMTNKTDNSSETINITLKNQSKENMEKNDSTNYIIEMNQRLLLEKEELIAKNNVLECNIESNEDDMARTEKTNVHLKGILKNFLEITNLNKKISTSRKLICTHNEIEVKELVRDIEFIRNISIILNSIFLSIIFLYYESITFIFSCFITITPVIYIYSWSNFTLVKHIKIIDQIKSYEKEIKSLESSLDFINEYIDSI